MSKQYMAFGLNLNGTSYETLKSELTTALSSCNRLIHDGHAVTCHPRDFQFEPDGAWLIAHKEKEHFMSSLMQYRDYLEQLLSSLEDQRR